MAFLGHVPRWMLLGIGLLLSLRVAIADDIPKAREYFQKGKGAYGLGQYTEAAGLYEKAFALHPDPALLFNAAQAHRLAGNKLRALALYENYLRMFDNAPNAPDVKRKIAELRNAIAVDDQTRNSPPTRPVQPTELDNGDKPASEPRLSTEPSVTKTTTTTEVTRPAPAKPLYKRPWLWATVGVGAVVIITGIAVGVTLGTTLSDPNPSYGRVEVK